MDIMNAQNILVDKKHQSFYQDISCLYSIYYGQNCFFSIRAFLLWNKNFWKLAQTDNDGFLLHVIQSMFSFICYDGLHNKKEQINR